VTEIPEHLLKRSKERREAASGGASSDSGASVPATTSSAPAVAKPTAPVVASAPAPKPDPSYVVAAKTRKKIPFWAMATLSLLPLWAFLYLIALKPQEKVVEGPMAMVKLFTEPARVATEQQDKAAQAVHLPVAKY
jgi:hypothetical protein